MVSSLSEKQKIWVAIFSGAALGAAVTLVVVLVGLGLHKSDPSPVDKGRAYSVVEGKAAASLAARFRPWLLFDSKERWRPLSIPSLFEERDASGAPAQEFCTRTVPKPSCKGIGDMADFTRMVSENSTVGVPGYIDLAGTSLGEYHARDRSASCRSRGLLDCGDIDGSAIYYRVTSSNGRFYIDYWWFLRYNHFGGAAVTCLHPTVLCDEHEGDWEGVTMVTKPEDSSALDYVAYAAHKGVFRYSAEELEMSGEHRPKVFVARGSHASYPSRCSSPCFQPAALAVDHLLDVPEGSTDGGAGWERNGASCKLGTPQSCLLPLPAPEVNPRSWTSWPGLWGETCGERCGQPGHPQSPDSPGQQTRFQFPWCSTQGNGGSICDGAVQGCGDWLGPGVAALACDPMALAQGLVTPEQLSPGGLELKVVAREGAKPDRNSATTRGIVQALGEPLGPGGQVVVSGAGLNTEILVRARVGLNLVEARFDVPSASEGALTIAVSDVKGLPVALGATAGGAKVEAVEARRIRLVADAAAALARATHLASRARELDH